MTITREYRHNLRGRRECWAAVVDGTWRVERDEDYGTTWSIKHLPTGTILPSLHAGKVWRSDMGATVATVFGTLDRACKFIQDGRADELLDLALAEVNA